MRIENEVKGHVKIHTSSRLQIELWIKDKQVDFFTLDLEAETVEIHVEKSTRALLGMRQVYEDYIKLIADLGLEMPGKWKKHWAPKTGEGYFYIDSEGEVCPNYIANFGYNEVDQKRYENYNMFPAKELAEKTINVSKLGRLILLWQYANDCLFMPEWKNVNQPKHSVIYVEMYKELRVDTSYTVRNLKTYFETAEQIKTFIKTYDKEIKKIMGVI